MTKGICSVDDCAGSVRGRSLCNKHLLRLRNTGTTDLTPREYARQPCVIPGCTVDDREACHYPECGRPLAGRGLCQSHKRMLKRGEALRPIQPRTSKVERGSQCQGPECDKPSSRVGYCPGHARQHYSGRPLTPLAPRKPGGIHSACIRDAKGAKRCTRCGVWQSEDNFYRAHSEPDQLTPNCRTCHADTARVKKYRGYGLTPERYAALLLEQGGTCAICRKQCSRGELSVDHDHECCPGKSSCGGCVRGLLCRACNYALGLVGDDPEVLRAAADYLER